MPDFTYSVITAKSFDDAVAAVEENTAANGFRVLHTHDVTATLAEKGFQREPLKIVEVCNARYAHEVLLRDVTAALMLPCPIVVYREGDQTHICTMLPAVMERFYPGKGIGPLADLVQKIVVDIVDASAR